MIAGRGPRAVRHVRVRHVAPPRAIRYCLVLLVLVATGCAGIPTSGPVRQGAQVGPGGDDQVIRVIARPPRPGLTPVQVVQGFLEASASFEDDHAVARQYLTSGARMSWDPAARVQVSAEPSVALTETAPGVVSGAATLDSTLAADGSRTVADAGTRLTPVYNLVRENGEWRIAVLDPGLVLSRSDLDRGYRQYAVYFFDPLFQVLVPDLRLVPATTTGMATYLTRLLVAGPSSWLAPAVRTAVPAGADLALQAVPVDFGNARVDLVGAPTVLDDPTADALRAQLSATLRQLPEVQAVTLLLTGQLIPASGPAAADPWSTVVSATGYGLDGRGGIVALDEFPASGPSASAGGYGAPPLRSVAVARDQRTAVGVDADGTGLWSGDLATGAAWTQRFAGADLSRPSFDRWRGAWFVDRGGVVRYLRPDGSVTRVSVSGLGPASTVLAVAVPSDATRIALTVRTGARTELMVARVEDRAENPRIAAPRRIESRLDGVSDVAWSAAAGLTVLATEGAGTRQAFTVDTGLGIVTGLGSPADPVQLAAYPGQRVLVAAGDGIVYQPTVGVWAPYARASAPTYAG
ncbi:MAG: hypothetical protein EPO13_07965 [Actinomycetota bacterium]|nr:MAG: hypothetical protein EPO13_07965 [Actinomycetota bacterium]